ncbi:MAG TPA: hypothetical protein VIP51_08510 [Eoetvoesiella sp.]
MIFKKIATLVRRVMVSDKQKKLLSASKKAASLQRAGKKTNHGDHKLDGGIGVVFFGSQVRL